MKELINLVQAMDALINAKAELEADLKAVSKDLDELRLRQIPDLMAELEIRTLTINGVRGGSGRIGLTSDLYVSISDKEKGYDWIKENGYDGIIVPYIHPSTLKATVKAALAEGEEFPEELFNINPFMRATLTKVNKK